MHNHRLTGLLTALTLSAALSACDSGDPVGPDPVQQVPADQLVFVRAAADAPPLEMQQVQFWAVAGETRETEIRYAPVGEYDGDRCLEFKVPGDALLRRPDGTAFQKGDSVLITVRVVDPALFDFEFSPSGLQFSPDHPAELRVSYKWANPDLNGDGVVDSRDSSVDFGFWKQESDSDPWTRIGTARLKDLQEIRADLTGFTKYAVASE